MPLASLALMPPPALPSERLQKLIAATGLCSRRRAEDLLRAGRVRVNGRPAGLGDRADLARDQILVDGRPLRPANAPLTLLLHKPIGVLSSCHDPRGRPTVLDLLPAELRQGVGLHPVGRLDSDSRGALLLSNDGRLTLELTHPRYGHAKTYRVRVAGQPTAEVLAAWRRGVPLDGVPSQPLRLRRLWQGPQDTWLELVMHEGRNRQIRRTAALLGHPVRDLQRIAIGPLGLGDLPEGAWRPLRPAELAALQAPAPLHPVRPDPDRLDPDQLPEDLPHRDLPHCDLSRRDLPHRDLPHREVPHPDHLNPDPSHQDRMPRESLRRNSPQPERFKAASQAKVAQPDVSQPASSRQTSMRQASPRQGLSPQGSSQPELSRPASWQSSSTRPSSLPTGP
jgi:pseudouridine synthase